MHARFTLVFLTIVLSAVSLPLSIPEARSSLDNVISAVGLRRHTEPLIEVKIDKRIIRGNHNKSRDTETTGSSQALIRRIVRGNNNDHRRSPPVSEAEATLDKRIIRGNNNRREEVATSVDYLDKRIVRGNKNFRPELSETSVERRSIRGTETVHDTRSLDKRIIRGNNNRRREPSAAFV